MNQLSTQKGSSAINSLHQQQALTTLSSPKQSEPQQFNYNKLKRSRRIEDHIGWPSAGQDESSLLDTANESTVNTVRFTFQHPPVTKSQQASMLFQAKQTHKHEHLLRNPAPQPWVMKHNKTFVCLILVFAIICKYKTCAYDSKHKVLLTHHPYYRWCWCCEPIGSLNPSKPTPPPAVQTETAINFAEADHHNHIWPQQLLGNSMPDPHQIQFKTRSNPKTRHI